MIKIALAQINPCVGDLAANSAKIIANIKAARAKGADIVVLPELALVGYPPEDLLLKPHFIEENLRYLTLIKNECKGIIAFVGFVDKFRGKIYNSCAFIEKGSIREGVRRTVMSELRAQFRPEFLNRVDEIVLFKPLTREEMVRIVDLQLEDLKKRLAEQGISLEVKSGARDLIAEQAYDPIFGARPLKRFIQQHVETPVARKLIGGEAREGAALKVSARNGQLLVE